MILRSVLVNEPLLLIDGVLQNQDGVIHVKAEAHRAAVLCDDGVRVTLIFIEKFSTWERKAPSLCLFFYLRTQSFCFYRPKPQAGEGCLRSQERLVEFRGSRSLPL